MAKKSINYDLPDLDRFLEGRGRKFVTYQEGSDLYGIPYYSFVRLAKEAGANITLRKNAIGEITGGLIEGRGSRNPCSPGSYRTAGGSRVQNREMESDNSESAL